MWQSLTQPVTPNLATVVAIVETLDLCWALSCRLLPKKGILMYNFLVIGFNTSGFAPVV
jgi:hypothetical protein